MDGQDDDRRSGAKKPRKGMGALAETWQDFRKFSRDELWDMDLAALPRMRKFGISLLRILILVGKGFVADNCGLQASALTYITLMSLVPLLALTFSASKGLGVQETIMQNIGLRRTTARTSAARTDEARAARDVPKKRDMATSDALSHIEVVPKSKLADLPPQLQQAIVKVFNTVDATDFSKLGVVGSLLLIWTVIKVMGRVEMTFNSIWGVHESRSLQRKFADYLSVLFVVPFLLLAATSLTTVLSSGRIVATLQAHMGSLFWVYRKLISLAGLAVLLTGFSFLYIFMPNTRVKLFPALAGGVCGGGLWFAAQLLYIHGQIGLAKYNAIYGTFAAIPIFLAWLYLSWVIVLFGGEVAFAVQNHETYMLERTAENASFATREALGFLATYHLCRHYLHAGGPWSSEAFARDHGIPTRLMSSVVHSLVEKGVFLSTAGEEALDGYVPARPPERLTLRDVAVAFRGEIDPVTKAVLTRTGDRVGKAMALHLEAYEQALAGQNFRELVQG
ncbi:MAG: YihY family inner membrane protein [Kiritimatiellaeota bacterium]|nr:YihY family inner membrane protein [Kiritimatiellota bacterium]